MQAAPTENACKKLVAQSMLAQFSGTKSACIQSMAPNVHAQSQWDHTCMQKVNGMHLWYLIRASMLFWRLRFMIVATNMLAANIAEIEVLLKA